MGVGLSRSDLMEKMRGEVPECEREILSKRVGEANELRAFVIASRERLAACPQRSIQMSALSLLLPEEEAKTGFAFKC
jgi:hypothetical protein